MNRAAMLTRSTWYKHMHKMNTLVTPLQYRAALLSVARCKTSRAKLSFFTCASTFAWIAAFLQQDIVCWQHCTCPCIGERHLDLSNIHFRPQTLVAQSYDP
eukprot:m.1328698 g.1328698  ORF g.1328698 m.1328698 type:complete len:101 (+) comp24859_c0_seq4:1848-2150(+)